MKTIYKCDHCGKIHDNYEEAEKHEEECISSRLKEELLSKELLKKLEEPIKYNDKEELLYLSILKEEQLTSFLDSERIKKNIFLINGFFDTKGFKELTKLREFISKEKIVLEVKYNFKTRTEVRDYLAHKYYKRSL